MSYLLDALRKSEQERQQKTPVPGLQSSAVEWENSDDGRSRSPWLLVAVVAIVLNTVLLAVLVWRFGFADRSAADRAGDVAATAVPAPAASNAPTMPAVIVVQQPAAQAVVQESIVVRERRDPASLQTGTSRQSGVSQPYSGQTQYSGQPQYSGQTQQQRSGTSSPYSGNPGAGNADAGNVNSYANQSNQLQSNPNQSAQGSLTTQSTESSSAAAGASAANTGESFERSSVPSVHSLSADVRRQLPYLAMNSHIYANNAKDSFVMINGTSFSPGQLVAEGLKLVAVVPEGAVLEINGTRFMLPALATFSP